MLAATLHASTMLIFSLSPELFHNKDIVSLTLVQPAAAEQDGRQFHAAMRVAATAIAASCFTA